jgi:hypothetical protein
MHMKFFQRSLAGLAALCLAFGQGPAFAQSQTGLAVKDGAGAPQTVCTFTVTGQQVGCHLEYVWNGSAWVLQAVGAGTAANAIRTTLASDDPLVAGQGGASAAVAGGTGASTTNGFLRFLRDFWNGITVSGGRLAVDGSGVTQPVSSASLPLPTGAATDATIANQQATPGSDASKAVAVQGVTGGKAVPTTESTTYATTLTASVTRPADTTQYTANDAWADSTSAPTSGGFTLTNACRVSGGSGVIVSATIVSSNDPTVLLQGEIELYDSSVTAVNDNAAFAISDSDEIKKVPGGTIPFLLSSTKAGSGTNSEYTIGGLNIAYTCSGSANLRFLLKNKNAYTPASGEVLTVRFGVIGTN